MAPSAVLLVMCMLVFGRTLDLSSKGQLLFRTTENVLSTTLTEVKVFCPFMVSVVRAVATTSLLRSTRGRSRFPVVLAGDSRFVLVPDDSNQTASSPYDVARSRLTFQFAVVADLFRNFGGEGHARQVTTRRFRGLRVSSQKKSEFAARAGIAAHSESTLVPTNWPHTTQLSLSRLRGVHYGCAAVYCS